MLLGRPKSCSTWPQGRHAFHIDRSLLVMLSFGACQSNAVLLQEGAVVKCSSAWYRGCLHTGQRVTRFLRQSVNSKDTTARHAAVYATQAGSLGYVAPLLDQSAEPLLQKLQQQMVLAQPQPAGLNPAAFRYNRNTSACTSTGTAIYRRTACSMCFIVQRISW